jgi:hypothetical protein
MLDNGSPMPDASARAIVGAAIQDAFEATLLGGLPRLRRRLAAETVGSNPDSMVIRVGEARHWGQTYNVVTERTYGRPEIQRPRQAINALVTPPPALPTPPMRFHALADAHGRARIYVGRRQSSR